MSDVDGAWVLPPRSLDLGADEVHVWLSRVGWVPPDALRVPDAARERAQTYRREQDRARSLLAHAALHALLPAYADLAPSGIELDRTCRHCGGAHGKPRLAGPGAATDVRFNLSHADDVVLLAFARGREVGVDVEAVRPFDHGGVAEVVFAPAERAALAALPPERRDAAFFRLWTRKEAYAKMTGLGLASGADGLDVTSPDPSSWAGAGGPAASLVELDVGPAYSAALVVEGGPVKARTLAWRGLPLSRSSR